MVLLYHTSNPNRLEYTADFIFGRMLKCDVVFCVDKHDFESDNARIKINYSNQSFDFACIQILPSGFLSQNSYNKDFVVPYNPDTKLLFPDTLSVTGFDIFSAVFFLLSRYEEYENNDLDMHGRFQSQNSILNRLGLLSIPIVDIWIARFAEILGLSFENNLQLIPTLDIDIAYKYQNRKLFRQIGGVAKDFVRFNFRELLERFGVLLQLKEDSYNNFDYQLKVLKNQKAIYFFQVGNYGKWDKNIDIKNINFKKLINKIFEQQEVGIHPSWQSFLNKKQLSQEIKQLSEVVGKQITSCRFHFIRFVIPESYKILLECGIEHEYSMGYSDKPGFRAGTANSFYWYDLKEDKKTKLLVHPFCLMDVTLQHFQSLDVTQAIKTGLEYKNEIQKQGGDFVFVFHNESLSNNKQWAGWRTVFENWLENGD